MKTLFSIGNICEPAMISDTLITGVSHIDELAPNLYRIALHSESHVYGGEISQDVQIKAVLTGEAVAELVHLLSSTVLEADDMATVRAAQPLTAAVN